MASDLPFLPREWLKIASGIAHHSLAYDHIEDVPPEHRRHVIDRTGEAMEAQNVTPPENWRAALAKLCGWNDDVGS